MLLVSHDRALLRALCTRVWIVHETSRHRFRGSFAEWEVVSEEREHAARVHAAEEESLRRVHEKQETRRKESRKEKERETSRDARRRVEEAEALVTKLEA